MALYNPGVESPPLLLGHRGCRFSASVDENTLAAFELALRNKCDGFEFDVRLTGDEHAVVCHDRRSRRISIAKAKREHLQHLPSLVDVLAQFSKRAFLDIELKVRGLAAPLLSVLAEHRPERGHVVSSFLPDVLIELRELSETVPLGIIFERRVPRWWKLPVDYVISQHSLITPHLIREVHDAGRKLFAWTVNDRATMMKLAEWQADGIISDETELLAQTLRPGLQVSS